MVPCRARTLAVVGVALLISITADAQSDRPLRTFPQFAGTWVLDEAASTGRLAITPRIPRTMTIATNATEFIVTKQLRLGPLDRARETPPAEVYRFDGAETWLTDARTGVVLDISHRLTLVADMLALTVKEGGRLAGRPFTMVTDAYAVDGDVLTLHRQLSSVTAAGEVLLMQEPTNNFRHTYVYRRARQEPGR